MTDDAQSTTTVEWVQQHEKSILSKICGNPYSQSCFDVATCPAGIVDGAMETLLERNPGIALAVRVPRGLDVNSCGADTQITVVGRADWGDRPRRTYIL